MTSWFICEPDVRLRPSPMIYILGDCSWYYAGYMENGKVSIHDLDLGTTYTFGVWFDGRIYDFDFEVNQEIYEYEFILPEQLCDLF